jgi:hypothetical protein
LSERKLEGELGMDPDERRRMSDRKPLFSLGAIVATADAIAALEATGDKYCELLRRHERGDWGEIDPEDRGRNEEALKEGAQIFSVYRLSDGTKVWIITEADRSVTTLLLPDEY